MRKKRPIKETPITHPSGDDRYDALDLTMKQFKFEKDALLEVLNVAQGLFGYLSENRRVVRESNPQIRSTVPASGNRHTC